MMEIIPVNPIEFSFDIYRDLSIYPRKRKPGPPQRIDGMTAGILTVNKGEPHGSEVHPDGDELIYIIYGGILLTCDSDPEREHILGPGQACIVPKGEWHKVSFLEDTQLIHITPGPNGDHRPFN
ncbi:cupin domain-containing protein [Halomonas organivorans]|uniref:Quercetin dioxygenase-like cupin family protein n=1 Tax=Halomonas organivorans TaxID=257772 RepID=A0A7W5BVH0_9GAMM|nr:cupin domain-containing protein [Halomonas organivorans]MBB3139885.1 quercetin dioxygenase-like cupin family protein [Halomonas organivorans]